MALILHYNLFLYLLVVLQSIFVVFLLFDTESLLTAIHKVLCSQTILSD